MNPYLSILLIISAFTSLAGFVGVLQTKIWGAQASLIVSITWLIVAFYNFIFQNGTLLIPLLVLGLIEILLSIYSYYLIEKKGVVMQEVT